MNLLFTLQFDVFTGVNTWAYTLAKELEKYGHKITFFIENFKNTQFIQFCEQSNIQLIRDREKIKSFDVLFIQYLLDSNLVNLFDSLPQKKIITIHSLTYPINYIDFQSLKNNYETVSISEKLQHIYKTNFVIPNCIDTELFKPTQSENKKTPTKALFLSRYESHYNNNLLYAFKKMDISVTLSYNNYIYTDIPKIINDYDFIIGTGRSAYEAMSCEKPVFVASDKTTKGWITKDNFNDLLYYNLNPYYMNGLPQEKNNLPDLNYQYEIINEIQKYTSNKNKENRNLIQANLSSQLIAKKYMSLFS